MISRVCEEFGCDPLRAEHLLNVDAPRVLSILDLRAYKRAYDAYHNLDGLSDAAKRKVRADPLVQAVQAHDFAQVRQGANGGTDDHD